VRIFVKNKTGQLLLCLMEQKRWSNTVKYDIGASGAVPSKMSLIKTAIKEIKEELGIEIKKSDLNDLGFKTPSDGLHCIVKHYIVIIDDNTQLVSTDNTYQSFIWIDPKELSSFVGTVRDDPYHVLTLHKLL
jgi:hypothetical protein